VFETEILLCVGAILAMAPLILLIRPIPKSNPFYV